MSRIIRQGCSLKHSLTRRMRMGGLSEDEINNRLDEGWKVCDSVYLRFQFLSTILKFQLIVKECSCGQFTKQCWEGPEDDESSESEVEEVEPPGN